MNAVVRFWRVQGRSFSFYRPTYKVMLLLRLCESANRGAIYKTAPLPGFSTTQLATTIHAFRMAGLEVTLCMAGFGVTPEAQAGELHKILNPKA